MRWPSFRPFVGTRLLSSSIAPPSAPSLKALQVAASSVLRRKQQTEPLLSLSFPEHPLALNLEALSQMWKGDNVGAVATQSRVVKKFESTVGANSDDFVDLAGSLNDLACMRMWQPTPDLVSAEKNLKRAILMSRRAYSVNGHMMVCLSANLMEALTMGGASRAEHALQLVHFVMKQVNGTFTNDEKYTGVQVAKPDPLAEVTSVLWPRYRLAQVRLMAARCFFLLQSPEEGLIFFNSSLAQLSAEILLPLDLKRILCATALVDLIQLRRRAVITRHKDVSVSHIQQDHLHFFLSVMAVATADPAIQVCRLGSPLEEVEQALLSLLPHLPGSSSGTLDPLRRYVGIDLLSEDKLAPRHPVGLSLLDSRFYCAKEEGEGEGEKT